jgi:hypothetical protein
MRPESWLFPLWSRAESLEVYAYFSYLSFWVCTKKVAWNKLASTKISNFALWTPKVLSSETFKPYRARKETLWFVYFQSRNNESFIWGNFTFRRRIGCRTSCGGLLLQIKQQYLPQNSQEGHQILLKRKVSQRSTALLFLICSDSSFARATKH